jgi:hypothetical protein
LLSKRIGTLKYPYGQHKEVDYVGRECGETFVLMD